MTTNNPHVKTSGANASVYKNDTASSFDSSHSHWHVSNFIANIFSRAFLSLFVDFYSPLKHPAMR